MNGNIRVGNLFGIPFYINPSWFLVLGFSDVNLWRTNWVCVSNPGTFLPWLLGFVAALLLFCLGSGPRIGPQFCRHHPRN
jgi:hypothetical protein